MTNSPLVNYVKLSPNKTSPRCAAIRKITIHHMAGNLSVETCGQIFSRAERKGSSNYGIGSDGRVGMYVEEKDRAWTSGNADNDNQAITIEVANSGGAPDWPVSDAAYAKLIELCVDICQRNGIEALNYTGDASGNLTMHKWFQNTACPGPYLEKRFSRIAQEVNEKLKEYKYPAETEKRDTGQSGAPGGEEEQMRYNKMKDVPAGAYKTTLDKLIAKGFLAGKGGTGDERVIDLTEDSVRLLVVLDRAGVFGK